MEVFADLFYIDLDLAHIFDQALHSDRVRVAPDCQFPPEAGGDHGEHAGHERRSDQPDSADPLHHSAEHAGDVGDETLLRAVVGDILDDDVVRDDAGHRRQFVGVHRQTDRP